MEADRGTIAAAGEARLRVLELASTWWRALRADLLALVSYGVAVALFFWQLLFLPGVSVPKGGGDLASFLYPGYSFAAESLQHGVVPLWNPYLFAGAPFAADVQSGLYYPPNLIAFFLARPFTYATIEGLAVFHYLLAAMCAFWLGRGLGFSWAGAFGAGLIYAFGGFSVAHLAHLNMLAAAAWVPLVFLLFHKALNRRSLGWAAGAGAAYAVSILAGHTQVSLYTALLLGLYWLWELGVQCRLTRLAGIPGPRKGAAARRGPSVPFDAEGRADVVYCHSERSEESPGPARGDASPRLSMTSSCDARPALGAEVAGVGPGERQGAHQGAGGGQAPALRTGDWGPVRRRGAAAGGGVRALLVPLATLPACVVVALGLAAVQLLPMAELMRLSLRADLSYAKALEFAASPLGLITLLVPHFFGDSPSDFWGFRWSLTEVYGYAGLLTFALAAVVFWVARPRLAVLTFFGLLAPLALLLSLGEHTALYGLLYRFVPGFDKVRAAGRFLMLFDLALAVLAGGGLTMMSRPLRARWRPRYRRLLRASAVVLGGALLLAGPIFYHALLTSQDKDAVIVRRLSIAIDSFNLTVLFLALGVVVLYLYRRRFTWYLPYLAVGLLVLDLFSANAGLNPTTENVLSGFQHPGIVEYLKDKAGGSRIDSATGAADLWQPNAGLLHGIPDVQGLFNPMTLADYQRYWENLGSRAAPGYDLLNVDYVIGKKDVALDRAKFQPVFEGDPALNVYRNASALPRAFFAEGVEVLPREEQLARLRAPAFEAGRIALLEPGNAVAEASAGNRVLGYRYPTPNEVRVAVEAPRAGYLVLAEVYYPGWQAFVDGKEVPLRRADYTFRAVPVSAGARDVHLVFAPRLWYLGLGISTATLLLLAAVGIRGVRRARGVA